MLSKGFFRAYNSNDDAIKWHGGIFVFIVCGKDILLTLGSHLQGRFLHSPHMWRFHEAGEGTP